MNITTVILLVNVSTKSDVILSLISKCLCKTHPWCPYQQENAWYATQKINLLQERDTQNHLGFPVGCPVFRIWDSACTVRQRCCTFLFLSCQTYFPSNRKTCYTLPLLPCYSHLFRSDQFSCFFPDHLLKAVLLTHITKLQ